MRCLNCFGGLGKVRRAPLPRGRLNIEAFSEKGLLASRKPSSAADYEHHEGGVRSSTGSKRSMQGKSVAASDKTRSDVLPPPSPPIEFVFDIPTSQLDQAESEEKKCPEESKEATPTEPSSSTEPAAPDQRAESPTVPPSLASPSPRLPQRTSSAASSINSKPRSRRSPSSANSTKATTTSLHGPADETPKPIEPTMKATSDLPSSPVVETPKSDEPTIKLITTPPHSPIDETPEPTKTSTTAITKPDSEKLIEASSSPTIAKPTTIPTADIKTSPLLNIDTKSALFPPKNRPSFESDTPLTPTTSAKLNNLNRISTAPPETPSSQALEKAASNSKRKSRVSRFFSVKEASTKRKSAFPVVVVDKVEEVSVEPRRVGSKRKEAREGEGADRGLEKELEVGVGSLAVDIGPKVEGRKWKVDADNDSLFCY